MKMPQFKFRFKFNPRISRLYFCQIDYKVICIQFNTWYLLNVSHTFHVVKETHVEKLSLQALLCKHKVKVYQCYPRPLSCYLRIGHFMAFDQIYPPSNLWNINFDIYLSWKVCKYVQSIEFYENGMGYRQLNYLNAIQETK